MRPEPGRPRHHHGCRRTCSLTATPDRLEATATAVDAEALGPVQDVITRHLVRLAVR
ncbi:DUF2218 domain-containing protein [Streptomyces sp. NPDC053069]|uniref:DUF2218 domain-containing protein n=1 Tax=Streptomyces sp. NPDC053069 TaxID=3365695 RepID=UPI0037D8B9E3